MRRIIGFLRGHNGRQTDGYLRPEKFAFHIDGFLRGNNGPLTEGYLRAERWAFDVVAEAPPAMDVTGTAAGAITALTGMTVGAHGVKGDAEGSVTAITGAAAGAHGVTGDAEGTIAEISGTAAGAHTAPAPPAVVSNQGGYGGEIRARRRVEEPEDVRRAKARRAVMAKLYPVAGTARGQLGVVYGLAAGKLGARGGGFGAIGHVSGQARGEFSPFSSSEIEEIMSLIEGIEAIEVLSEAA